MFQLQTLILTRTNYITCSCLRKFPALFVRTVTFPVFEHCKEHPTSHWKEQ